MGNTPGMQIHSDQVTVDDGRLELLRAPFPPHQISKLPKGTKAQNECLAGEKRNCSICAGWHHPMMKHLDYVGHAALTDRLLDCDPEWNWNPLALDEHGLPRFDSSGGLWIKLTVCGVTRLGYGHAEDKSWMAPGDRIKEMIGDCLVRGTLISTARGDVPIESVVIGDLVPTRQGWKPVTDHWRSSQSAPIVKACLSNGSSITGTPHHRVPTYGVVKRLHELRRGDILYQWEGRENYQAPRISSGKAESIGDTHHIQACPGSAISWGLRRRAPICTGRSIDSITGSYRPAVIFIIKIMTGATTIRQTLRQLGHQIINDCTQLIGAILPIDAAGAMVCFYPPSEHLAATVRGGALQGARRRSAVMTGLRISGRDRQQPFEISFAQSVIHRFNPLSHGRGFAQVRVSSAQGVGRGEVWNLSVGDTHEYVANGTLSLNSLRNAAMRFGAALELWHKGELHVGEEKKVEEIKPNLEPEIVKRLEASLSLSELQHEYGKLTKEQRILHAGIKDGVKARF